MSQNPNDGTQQCRYHPAFITKKLSLIASLIAIYTPMTFALPVDVEQTIHITADSSVFDYRSGVNTYEGNVKVDQGTTHLTADRVITKNNAKHKIDEAIAYGIKNQAEYITIPKAGDELFHAKAKVITFYPPKSEIVLEGNVTVTQGENSFNGPLILYNIKDQIVTAPASKGGRATIVIEPKKLES